MPTYAVYKRHGKLKELVDVIHHPTQQIAFLLALRRQSKAYADAGLVCPAFQTWESVVFFVEEVK